MALELTNALQTKCKTCFVGPRMVLHAHLKNTFSKFGLGFYVPSETPPPPSLVEDQTSSDFFSLPSLSKTSSFHHHILKLLVLLKLFAYYG